MILKFEHFLNESKKFSSVEKQMKKAFKEIKNTLEDYQAQTEENITKKMIKDAIKKYNFDTASSTKLFKDLEFLLKNPFTAEDDEL